MRRETKFFLALALAVSLPAVLTAALQASKPDFSGHWSLDISASQVPNLGDIESKKLTVKHQEPKIQIVSRTVLTMGSGANVLSAVTDGVERESTGNEEEEKALQEEAEQSGRYTVGGTAGSSKTRVKALWNGERLVIASTMIDDENGVTIEKEQTWTLSPDGRTLTVEFVRKGGPGGETKGTEVYRKK